jgi:hypothetical protein
MNTRLTEIARLLFVGLLLFSSGKRCDAAQVGETNTAWCLEISTAKNTYRVRPDGSGWTEMPHVASRGVLSPDGKRVVYADVPEDNKPRWNAEVFVANADGKNTRRLTKGAAQNFYPAWSWDGKRIIFASDRAGKPQIYAMDPDGANAQQLTHEPEGVRLLKLAPDGRLAYFAHRKRTGIVWLQDLIVRNGEKSEAIAQNQLLYQDLAWSPDGKTIAYGKIGSLVFHDLASGKQGEVNFAKDIDTQMGSHAASNIAWRPDNQAVASFCTFLGQRGANGPKMFGDEEIFIIPRAGRPNWFTIPLKVENPPTSIRWVRQHDSRLAAEGHPEWKKLTSFLGEPYDSEVVQNFVRAYSLKSGQKFDEGSFSAIDQAYTLMFRGGKISDIILRVAPFPKGSGDPGWIPYSKPLPGNLLPADRRADVVKKLGQPIPGKGNTDRDRDSWVADGVTIWVLFNKDNGSIDELFLSPAKK